MSSYQFFQLLFWIPVGFLFYSYFLYPVILEVVSVFKRKKQIPASVIGLPFVSILLSAYNEEKVLVEKIRNIFNCDYPKDKLEVIVGNDCSSDSTKEILNKLKVEFPELVFHNYNFRRGKPAVLNDLVKEANHEIILLTDANILFEKDAIIKLTEHFSDLAIGLVGGNILNKASGKGISNQEKTYIYRENRIKFLEGKNFGCMIGPFGGFYALRKNLYQAIPENFLVDDFYICMNVLKQKFKSISESKAIAYEEVSEDWRQEYKRKVRISSGNFQNLIRFEIFLLRFNSISFCFFSHKVLRWLGPFFILTAFLINIPLAISDKSSIYYYLLLMQVVLFISPFVQRLLEAIPFENPIWKSISYFYTMNFALLVGWFRFIKGIKSGVWTPTKR